jgi:alkanesulfonate monooxygenase SsuD/methylene tetrahydromethanopterin reductase-like flavin-dependent oxidoreductase (luciferase family)
MDLGVHLPLTNPQPRLRAVVETARDCGFAAVSANDHLELRGPWVDGPTALASVIDASEGLTLAMTAALPVVRGPVALAMALAAIDLLSGKYGDGWLASAYNTTPERFAAAREQLPDGFPNALATMWTYVCDDPDRVLRDVLGPLVGRDPDELRDRVCVGPPGHCAELLARYAEAGCQRVYLWPLGDEQRQLERISAAAA